MSDSGVLSEFDPLSASKSTPGQTTGQDEEKATGEVGTKSSVLDEFDPLTRQGGADKGQASHSVKQGFAAPVLTMPASTSQSSSDISPHKSTQSHTCSYQNGSSKAVCKVEQSSVSKGVGVAISAVSKSDRIGAEISQIDSVLKALNMGQFDLATMSSVTAKSQPHNKPKSSQV